MSVTGASFFPQRMIHAICDLHYACDTRDRLTPVQGGDALIFCPISRVNSCWGKASAQLKYFHSITVAKLQTQERVWPAGAFLMNCFILLSVSEELFLSSQTGWQESQNQMWF